MLFKNDLRADNEFIESLLTDLRNKVKETYTSMEYDLYSLNDESLQLISTNDDGTSQPSIINPNNEDVNSINSKQTNADLSSHDNEDYFYYTANSKKDLTENSNLFKSAATDADDNDADKSTLNDDNDGSNLIKKSLSILSSVSSNSTNNSTISSSISNSSSSPNNPNKTNKDRVVLIRHKF